MKRRSFSLWSMLIVLGLVVAALLVAALPAHAQEPPPPEEVCDKFGKCELDNVLDPRSPNYNPAHRYGGEGSRFGPPGKRSEDVPALGGIGALWTYHNYFGTHVYSGKSVERIWARQKISTSLDLNDTEDYLYAPTLMAPDYCRLESVAYYHYNGSSTDRYWKVFSHGSHSFIWGTPMNTSFCSRYENSGYVSTMVFKSGSTWYVNLYDWIDSEWDYVTSESGNGDHSHGWDIWEEYDLNNNWPDLPQLRSYYLRVYVNGKYKYVTRTYGTQVKCLPGGFPYDYGWNSKYYDWYVGP